MKTVYQLMALLICLCLPVHVFAACQQMSRAIALASEGVIDVETPDPQVLIEIDALIADVNNDTLLLGLQRAGRGTQFGDLRNFLTQLRFFARQGPSNDLRLDATLTDTLGHMQTLVRETCSHPHNISTESQTNPKAGSQKKLALLGAKEKSFATLKAERDAEERAHSAQLANLATVVAGFAIAISTGVVTYYGITLLKILRRGRRTCSIPAQIEQLGEKVPGRITIIGKLGCRFVPDTDKHAALMETLVKGSYANIIIQDALHNARIIKDPSEGCSMFFTDALSAQALRGLLAASDGPVRFDLARKLPKRPQAVNRRTLTPATGR